MNGYITRIQSLESENQKSENQGGRGNPDEKLSVFFFSGVREASPAGSQYVEKLCQHSMEMYKKLAQLVDLCKRTIKTRKINNWMLFHNSVAGEAAGKVMP